MLFVDTRARLLGGLPRDCKVRVVFEGGLNCIGKREPLRLSVKVGCEQEYGD